MPGGRHGRGGRGPRRWSCPLQAVYKPASGEQSLWDFPDGLYRREVAAYVLSEALGWGLVPPTVERHDGPFGAGSLQLFVAADYEQHYFTLLDEGGPRGRAGGHVRLRRRGQQRRSQERPRPARRRKGACGASTTGSASTATPKLRTVIWDFADEPVPSPLLADLRRLASDLPVELARLLDDGEQAAIVDRIDRLVHTGTFPEPLGDRPPYPWPLV